MTSLSDVIQQRHYFSFRVLVYLVYNLLSDCVLHHCNAQAQKSFTVHTGSSASLWNNNSAPRTSRCLPVPAPCTKCPGQSAPIYTTTGMNNVELSIQNLRIRIYKYLLYIMYTRLFYRNHRLTNSGIQSIYGSRVRCQIPVVYQSQFTTMLNFHIYNITNLLSELLFIV